jgi:hypothetical protein
MAAPGPANGLSRACEQALSPRFGRKVRQVSVKSLVLSGMAVLALAGCTPDALPFALPGLNGLPAMPWDGRPEAAVWTRATLLAVQAQDDVLAGAVPSDVATYCPGYATGGMAERRDFWVALVALTAERESGFNPAAVGPGGFYGLMQIAPRTAQTIGCGVGTKAELKDGENNLFCAVQVLAGKVAMDGQAVGAKGTKGIGRDWMPWRQAAMRSESAAWLKTQSYCR